ncbi:MAG: tyrosine-type recombinase/integrase [Desulfomonile tiedjei]|nr:tyrosine-type recombinase/integrase [Desulfomonile tiedjei]
MVTKRGKTLYIYFKPFKDKKIGVRVDVNTAREANQIEGAVLRACRTGSYEGLDPIARETCIRMFTNQKWELPPALADFVAPVAKGELTLRQAVEIFIKYPEIHDCQERPRYEQCIEHLVEHFGQDCLVKSIWVPEIKEYMAKRLEEGAAPSTVNRQKGTLSKMFQVLVEKRYADANPVRLVKNLSQKSEERQVYLSVETVRAIADRCPPWYQPMLWMAFHTGMREGEILGLTRKQMNLSERMVYLGPEDTKEGHWKRVPIHKDLVTILQDVLDGPALLSGKVFALQDGKGLRDLDPESFKNVWPRVRKALGFKDPLPRFHDLRHTWRTNARRSGVDPQIAESIMGHWLKGRSVNDRYGYIGDKELLQAIDKITFDHGETKVFVARSKESGPKGNKRETNGGVQEKRSCGNMT